jgi:hypothetical protein
MYAINLLITTIQLKTYTLKVMNTQLLFIKKMKYPPKSQNANIESFKI